MDKRATLTVLNDFISIEIDQSEIGSKLEEEQLKALISVINLLGEAGVQLAATSEKKTSLRLRAILAQDLKFQIALSGLVKEADLFLKIVIGDERIEDHGFPEFKDD